MAAQEKYINAEAFWELAHLPENADKRLDLIEGVIYALPLAGFEQGAIGGNLIASSESTSVPTIWVW